VDGSESSRVDFLSVVKNRIFCNEQAGCFLIRSSGIFQSNDIYKNTKANAYIGSAAPGVTPPLFSETCVFDGLDCGFLFDSGSKAKLIRCVIHSNAGAGVTVLGQQGPVCLPYLFDCELRDGKDSGILFVGPYAGGDFEANKVSLLSFYHLLRRILKSENDPFSAADRSQKMVLAASLSGRTTPILLVLLPKELALVPTCSKIRSLATGAVFWLRVVGAASSPRTASAQAACLVWLWKALAPTLPSHET
jgi:hypothetical protein